MDRRFAPRPGRFATQLDLEASTCIGTGGLVLTANTTTTFRVPTPNVRSWIETISILNGIVGLDSDGTILATVFRRDNTNAANIALTAATSLEVDFLTANNKVFGIPLLAALTDTNRICLPGDTVYVDVVNNSAAIDTQPNQNFVQVEFAILQ